MELRPPFTYLHALAEQVSGNGKGGDGTGRARKIGDGSGVKRKRTSVRNTGSLCVSLGDPIGLSGRNLLHAHFGHLSDMAQRVLARLYSPEQLSNVERNERIRTLHAGGVGVSELGRQFEVSPQRVWQIVRGRNH